VLAYHCEGLSTAPTPTVSLGIGQGHLVEGATLSARPASKCLLRLTRDWSLNPACASFGRNVPAGYPATPREGLIHDLFPDSFSPVAVLAHQAFRSEIFSEASLKSASLYLYKTSFRGKSHEQKRHIAKLF
jgi:hypothetical protein